MNTSDFVHCHKMLHFSTIPANLGRKSPAAAEIPLEPLDCWHSEFDSTITIVTDDISKSEFQRGYGLTVTSEAHAL